MDVEKAKRVDANKDDPVSIEKHGTNTTVSRLESEVAQAQAEVAEAAAMVPKSKFQFLISSVPFNYYFFQNCC